MKNLVNEMMVVVTTKVELKKIEHDVKKQRKLREKIQKKQLRLLSTTSRDTYEWTCTRDDYFNGLKVKYGC